MLTSFAKQLPFFGFLFFVSFVVSTTIFVKYRTRRPRTSLILYYLGFVTLALSVGEIWMWAQTTFSLSTASPRPTYASSIFIGDRELGYGLAAGPRQVLATRRLRTGELIYKVTYTINAVGIRQTPQSDAGPPAFFFGDSFTFGEGVDDADSLPAWFAKISGDEVFNLGVPGYGAINFCGC